MKTLETDRLMLRLWKETDVADLFEYASDPQVGPHAGWPVHENMETSRMIVDRFIEDQDVYAIVLKSHHKVIGSLGVHDRKPDQAPENLIQKEIGYVLNPHYWGQGLMTEAVKCVIKHGFEALALDLIWCGYYHFNTRSKRVVEKCGFQYQWTISKTLPLLDNQEVEQLYYNITKEGYFSNKARSKQNGK
ncbi:MAG: GNAT family N-acetyltransferase [Defluviitaleaceae bacterium]|nr:GNAT family N-acetyltransferase [Defluviitaleaceae bacterium]